MTPTPTSHQHHHPQTSVDIINISTDFGPTTPPSASPASEQQLSTFMIESLKLLVTLSKPNLQLLLVLQLAWLPNHHHPTHLLPLLPPQQHQHQLHAPMLPLPPLRLQEINHLLLPSLHLIQVAKRKKKPAARPPPPSATKASATLARLFAPQSDTPSGYQFVYYATPVRRRLSELRRLVQGVGLNNSRVLDIQYPVQNVISFLVHNDYVLTLTKAMHLHGRGSSPLIDFDPCDPVNLKDPKFASLSRDLRVQKAIEIEKPSLPPFAVFCPSLSQFDAILKEEMLARSSSSAAAKPPSRSSDQERLAKKQRLSYLGYLLHHDAETASLLAYAVSPTLSATKDLEMSEPSDN
ncbi:uncharacterized protein ATC70_008059 [Mucor velutinosus]|uniref:Uncharacterized protein n=1 Tax=Mucor velutinosus TaxID=708070 RepID=A0AAN7D2K6_9FUNG|nr:hypothetical protein ATC70_008059 [Mucor velutinosus]